MTLQDFILIWQAQPFRAFRLVTVRGEFPVNYPLGIGLTAQMRVAVVVDNTRVETFALDQIERCDVFGKPMSLAEAMAAVSPETLASHAQLISAAQSSSEPDTREQQSRAVDRGKVTLRGFHAPDGVYVVHATVLTGEGEVLLSTAGTRWNVHGVEQFENGTSLYLHHLDHPAVEQRIILWPPDKGTFDSFAEALSISDFAKELHQRDAKLTAKPAKPVKPPASYFRDIDVTWKIKERDGWEEMFGEDNPAMDPARYEFALVPRTVDGREVRNPCLTDIMKEEILFNLGDTDWDATGKHDNRTWHVSLRHPSWAGKEIMLHIEVDRHAATVDDETTLLPLGWIERHLRNFALYGEWSLMYDALLAGPVKRNRPDVVVPLAGGFRAELWAGPPRFALPFLQPHIIDDEGRTVFDLRATAWSAAIRGDAKRAAVTLVLSSGEKEARDAATRYPLELDFVTHRVTCPNLEGSSTIGLVQDMVRRVRGVKWMLEEIPKWLEKGRSLAESA